MADPIPTSKPPNRSKMISGAVGGGVAAVVVAIVMFSPVVAVKYQEAYSEMQTKQESYVEVEKRIEQYTDVEQRQEPYTAIETRTNNLFTMDDTTIKGGEWAGQTAYIPAGRTIEFTMRASDTVRTFVVSKSDFEANNNQYSNPISEQSSARYGFTVPISDTYYFTFYNMHDGFFGIGAKNVGLYSATATATWDESVTQYRTVNVPVTKSHEVDVPVTKYRDIQEPITKYREATKNVTPIDFLTGKY